MTAAILDDPAALQALAPEWEDLWRRTPGATPFQSPHWLLPWWAVFGTGAPRVATWRIEGRLTGVLPAYVLDEPPGRKLIALGAGTTDYLDALGAGVGPMLHALLERAGSDGVRRCDMVDVPPGAALCRVRPPAGWAGGWSEGSACPVLAPIAIPPAMRRNLRLAGNRAARAGGLVVDYATAATLEAGLATLVDLHRARWRHAGAPGVLPDPAVRFHRLAAPGLLAAGLLRLALARVGGQAVAVVLALLDATRVHIYLSGYDRAWHHLSPGTLLFGALLDRAAAEGRIEAHFLRGREGYKYAWGAEDRMNAVLSLTHRDGTGMLDRLPAPTSG